MSYGIVRVQKMTSGSVKGIEIHDRREKDISHTNKDIDWERTRENYDLHPEQNHNFYQAIKERINKLELPKAVRKDAIFMAQVLVTSDHDFFKGLSKGQQEQFFKDSYNFLAERYGKENVISATVHLDEHTPHMHFNFVPVTADGRLSAKSVLTRQSLIEQQTAFQEQVGKHYGLERGLQGGKKKHLEIAELKQQTAIRKTKELQEKLEKTEIAVNATESRLESLQGKVMELSELQALEGKKSFTGALKNIPHEKFISLQRTAKINAEYVEELKATVTGLNGKIESLQTELLKKDNDLIENKMELKVIEKYSDMTDDIIGILKFKAQTSMDEEFKNILDFYYRKGITYIEKIKTKPVEEKAIKNIRNKYQSQGKNLIFFKKEKDGTQTAMIPRVLEEEFEKTLKTVKDNLLKQKKETQSFSQGFSR